MGFEEVFCLYKGDSSLEMYMVIITVICQGDLFSTFYLHEPTNSIWECRPIYNCVFRSPCGISGPLSGDPWICPNINHAHHSHHQSTVIMQELYSI